MIKGCSDLAAHYISVIDHRPQVRQTVLYGSCIVRSQSLLNCVEGGEYVFRASKQILSVDICLDQSVVVNPGKNRIGISVVGNCTAGLRKGCRVCFCARE